MKVRNKSRRHSNPAFELLQQLFDPNIDSYMQLAIDNAYLTDTKNTGTTRTQDMQRGKHMYELPPKQG
jgi:hypothetical protein